MQSDSLAQMDRLLLPAYLLTGSHEQAAQCLLEVCEDCADIHELTFNAVKEAVVAAAVRRIGTDLKQFLAEGGAGLTHPGEVADARRVQDEPMLTAASFRRELLGLDAFQRATLVLRFYERYPVSKVAALLRVSRDLVEQGWRQALTILVGKLTPALTDEKSTNGNAGPLDQADHFGFPVFESAQWSGNKLSSEALIRTNPRRFINISKPVRSLGLRKSTDSWEFDLLFIRFSKREE